jgi:hypothetical protein
MRDHFEVFEEAEQIATSWGANIQEHEKKNNY